MIGYLHYWIAKLEVEEINRSSGASDPGRFTLSDDKLRLLCPELYANSGLMGLLNCLFGRGWARREFLQSILRNGDTRAAVVLAVDPLLVACYNDDLDGVCVLRFPAALATKLRVGDRLVTSLNSMATSVPAPKELIAPDLVQGDSANPCYVNFWPVVADFVSDDVRLIELRKLTISDREYDRCRRLGEDQLRTKPGMVRDGRHDRSLHPIIKDKRA